MYTPGMRMVRGVLVGMAMVALASGGIASAEEKSAAGDPYPLAACPISGEELGSMGDPVVKTYDGREIRFCCGSCAAKFEANKSEAMAKVDEAIVEQQKPHYPAETCPVSGQELGSMGEPVNYVAKNRLFRLCCAGCKGKIDENFAEHKEALDEKVFAAQKADYPSNTCPISGKELTGADKEVDYVIANQLVRLCCPGCKSKVDEDPAKYLAKVQESSSSE